MVQLCVPAWAGGDGHRGVGEEHVGGAEEDGALPPAVRVAQEAVHRCSTWHGWDLLHADAGELCVDWSPVDFFSGFVPTSILSAVLSLKFPKGYFFVSMATLFVGRNWTEKEMKTSFAHLSVESGVSIAEVLPWRHGHTAEVENNRTSKVKMRLVEPS